ncbi:MAG TPA: flagellar basal body P-ring formation chaperone FlgA [candidate division Zixibacteria bacterium]|nr:flagellar basal body P-ring formation chaperone FlgA [candidate division Zixibacteria bacterium]
MGAVKSIALFCFLAAGLPAAAADSRQLFSRAAVEPAVRRHVLALGGWDAENVEVRVVPFPPVPLPAGVASYRILRPSKGVGPGTRNFLVAAEVGGREAARLWVKADIRIFETVVVASRPLARREVLKAGDVHLARRELSSLSSLPFTRLEDVIGKQVGRPIEIHEIVTANALDRPTLVRRGAAVVMVFETGSLRVETAGVAEEAGKAGELIQVRNPTSGKTLRAVVVDGRTVRVN